MPPALTASPCARPGHPARRVLLTALLVAAVTVCGAAGGEEQPPLRPRLLFRHAATAAGDPARHAAVAAHLTAAAPSSQARRRLLAAGDGGAPSPFAVGSLGAAVAVDYVDLPSPADAAWALAALRAHPDNHFAELDGVVTAASSSLPDDPLLADQAHLALAGLYSDSLATPAPGKAPAQGAWNRTFGTPDVVVCVMDSGIDITHPDLKDNIWTNDKEIPGNGVDDDGNGYVDDVHGIATYGPGGADVGDDYFHGTHLAGIVGAACNNGVGGCGVAPGVRLMACKFLDARGNGYTSDAVRCLNYAVTNKADVTLNSYGGLAADSAALKAAIGAAQAAGQVFVAAAGNDYGLDVDATPTYPAAYDMPAVLAVAASDGGGRLANFSNYGAARVAIAAPGVAILSTVPGGKYERHDGTSQAAAQVAGGLALLLSARRRAGWAGATAMSVREDLLAAARPSPHLKAAVASGGELDLAAAMARVPASGPRDPKASAWLVGVAEASGGGGGGGRGTVAAKTGWEGGAPTPAPASANTAGRPQAAAAAPAPNRAAAASGGGAAVSAFPAVAAADAVGGGVAAAAAPRGVAPLLPPPLFGRRRLV